MNEPILGTVVDGMAAERAGLRNGDRILTINNKPVATWTEVVTNLRASGTNPVTLTAESKGAVKSYTMTPVYDREAGRPLIGISPKFNKVSLGFFGSIKEGCVYTKNIIVSMLNGLYKIVSGKAPAEVAGLIYGGVGDGIAAGTAQVQAGGIHSHVAFSVAVSHPESLYFFYSWTE